VTVDPFSGAFRVDGGESPGGSPMSSPPQPARTAAITMSARARIREG
jgi:hypothetical protein